MRTITTYRAGPCGVPAQELPARLHDWATGCLPAGRGRKTAVTAHTQGVSLIMSSEPLASSDLPVVLGMLPVSLSGSALLPGQHECDGPLRLQSLHGVKAYIPAPFVATL